MAVVLVVSAIGERWGGIWGRYHIDTCGKFLSSADNLSVGLCGDLLFVGVLPASVSQECCEGVCHHFLERDFHLAAFLLYYNNR